MKVKNPTKKKFKRKMKNLYYLYDNNKITYDKLSRIRDSYLGHLKMGNCNGLIYNNIRKNYCDYGYKVVIDDLGNIIKG